MKSVSDVVSLFIYSDLVPKENIMLWLKHLRQEFPTVAFKASTQNQKANLVRAFLNVCCRYENLLLFYEFLLVGFFQSRSRVSVESATADLIKTSKCFGSAMLMKILGNYCRNRGVSTAIRVGIVGKSYRNTVRGFSAFNILFQHRAQFFRFTKRGEEQHHQQSEEEAVVWRRRDSRLHQVSSLSNFECTLQTLSSHDWASPHSDFILFNFCHKSVIFYFRINL